MKQKKKLLILILAVLFALSLPQFPVFAEEGWDGITESEPQGSGTSADPYLIGTPEELAWYRTEINDYDNQACAKLTADIDLNNKQWTPIGGRFCNAFSGDFNGDGHTISGLWITHLKTEWEQNCWYGFFGRAEGVSDTQRASIHDLTVKGSVTHEHIVYISAEKGAAAGLCGSASKADISRCKADVTVTVIEPSDVYATSAPAGGICGEAELVTITDCINYGSITGAGDAGGIIGHGWGFLTRCANYGNVVAGKGHAGGCIGWMGNRAEGDPLTINYCYNVGSISSTGRKDENVSPTGDLSAGGNAGGCIGYVTFGNNDREYWIISHCFSTGTVSAPNYAGSFAGIVWDPSDKVPSISFVDNCCLNTACDNTFGLLINHIADIPRTVTILTAGQMASADYVTALNESAGAEIFVSGVRNPVFKGLEEAPVITKGDIDGNGMIDEQDVTKLISHVLGLSSLTGDAKAAADMDNNSLIDENDVTRLIQRVLQ